MNTWKRLSLWAALALCVIFFLASIVAIIGSWYLRPSLIEGLQDIFQIVDNALEQSTIYLDALDEVLTEAQDLVDMLQTTLESVTSGVQERVEALRETAAIQEALEPVMNDIAEFTQGLREAYITFDTSIQGLNKLPFVELETPGDELIQSITDTKTDLQNQVNDLEESIQSFTTLSDEAINQLHDMLLATETTLHTFQKQAGIFGREIASIRSAVEELESRISSGVTWLTIAITIISIWIALGQAAIFIFAWSLLKGYDPLALWQQ
ncbi:hypothetical protein ACFLXI_05730 [Chloroflexota bacterium]